MIALALLLLAGGPDGEFARGLALAREGRWTEARAALEAGAASAPRDKRFPIELAGVAWRLHDRRAARRWLHRALALDSNDAYANEFLGTLYLLDGNPEAALRYWNRIGRPRIEQVRFEPEPRLDPVLADRALAFAPASVLRLEEYRASERRLRFLGAFVSPRLDIVAREDDAYDAVVRARERRGGWIGLLSGLPLETVYIDARRRSGLALASLARWDPDKRRAFAALSGPIAREPAWKWRVFADARDENWSVPGSGDFKLRKVETGAGLARLTAAGLEWSSGFSISSRTVPVSRDGVQLKAAFGAARELLRIPEYRLAVRARGDFELGRLLEGGARPFAKSQAGIEGTWRRFSARLRGGAIRGDAPFDERFIVGLERDTDLWLRGHAGSKDGRKGSAPAARSFALLNLDWDQPLWNPGMFSLSAGPLLDVARVRGEWPADPGAQTTLRLPGGPGATFSWSRRAFYVVVWP